MTILKGRVNISFSLWNRLGKPEYVVIGYDKEEKALGLKITDAKDPSGLRVCCYGDHQTPRLARSTYICNYIANVLNVDLEEKSVIFTHGVKIGEWSVFETRYAEINNKYKRGKHGA